MNIRTFFSRQARKPGGLFGRLIMPQVFDRGNAMLHELMLASIHVREDDHVLEIGFGTGKLIEALARRAPHGLIEGIDISETMTGIAKRRNKKLIAAGRVKLTEGNFDEATFNEAAFDVVCSANTLYFWPDAQRTVEKIARVLKPGGALYLGFADRSHLENGKLDLRLFKVYHKEDVVRLLKEAGFSKVTVGSNENEAETVYCAAAVK